MIRFHAVCPLWVHAPYGDDAPFYRFIVGSAVAIIMLRLACPMTKPRARPPPLFLRATVQRGPACRLGRPAPTSLTFLLVSSVPEHGLVTAFWQCSQRCPRRRERRQQFGSAMGILRTGSQNGCSLCGTSESILFARNSAAWTFSVGTPQYVYFPLGLRSMGIFHWDSAAWVFLGIYSCGCYDPQRECL
jgi:hypothetical protein